MWVRPFLQMNLTCFEKRLRTSDSSSGWMVVPLLDPNKLPMVSGKVKGEAWHSVLNESDHEVNT